jgi:hypothetical protein
MKKSLSLLERIKAKLNLGEEGQIQNFLDKQVKMLEREVKACEKNIENLKYNHESEIEKFKEQKEDALVELDSVYENIKASDVENNAKQSDYSSTYWYNVEQAESKVESIKKAIEAAEDKLKDRIKDIEEQIKERKRRIEKIS